MADNPIAALIAALANTDNKFKEVQADLDKQILQHQSRIPSENASNAEVIDFFITTGRQNCDEREKKLNIEKAELALWRVKFAAMPEPESDEQKEQKDDTYALLDTKEKLIGLQMHEVSVHRRVLDLLQTVYN